MASQKADHAWESLVPMKSPMMAFDLAQLAQLVVDV
jgi:hypothetical protein